jgi:thymidylate synthase ThyX
VSPQGHRLTTFKLRYPKFIHGEFMTHRVISRNASSSRAVPVAKLIQEVTDNTLRAAPVFWGSNQPGMQAIEEIDNTLLNQTLLNEYDELVPATKRAVAQRLWANAALEAARFASLMNQLGVHKQTVNRLLEPFSHINVVATATEWDNFFGLRLHKDAQPEMRALAVAMWEARKASEPDTLFDGCWHLPFVEAEDYREMGEEDGFVCTSDPIRWNPIKVSVARCARVSYESFETKRRSTVEEDIKLHDRLLAMQRDKDTLLPAPLHASPAEHQATPDHIVGGTNFAETGGLDRAEWVHPQQHGNLVGWRQYRKMLPGEAVAPLPEGYQ